LTKGKNICRITTHNLPIPLEKTEFVTYSWYKSSIFKPPEKFGFDFLYIYAPNDFE
jgi:hypothetical protein